TRMVSGKTVYLPLDRTQGGAGDEVFLQPWIDQKNGHGGKHDSRRLNSIGQPRSGKTFQGGYFNAGDTFQDVVQQQLNGVESSVVHEHQRIGKPVPASDGVKKGERGQDRLGKRQIDID